MNQFIRSFIVLTVLSMVVGGFGFANAQVKHSKLKANKISPKQEFAANNAVISFDHSLFNYGVVPRGEKVTHHFPVQNTGTDTLVITKIKPGCGCTTTRKNSIIIPPGESSFIDITYRSSKSTRQVGKVTKRIRVESTDSKNPSLSLSISAHTDTSDCMLLCTPKIVNYNDVLLGKSAKVKVELENLDSVRTELEIVSEPTSEFIEKYKIKKTKLKSGQKTSIEFKLRDDIPPGEFKTALTLQVKGDSRSRITIPVAGNVVESLEAAKAAAAKKNDSRHKTRSGSISSRNDNIKSAQSGKAKQVKTKKPISSTNSPKSIDDSDIR